MLIKYFLPTVFCCCCCLGRDLVGNLKTCKGKDVRFSSPFSSGRRIVIWVKKDCSSIDCDAGGGQGLMAVLMQSFCIQRQACKPGEVVMTAQEL